MVPIGLYSEDRTLYPLLSSALGRDFTVLLRADGRGMDKLIASGECDVLILDLTSNASNSIGERLLTAQRLIGASLPAIVMADDSLRSTAFEMVRAGAFAYCRRPPSIRDLKALLNRAHETAALKRQAAATLRARQSSPDSCDGIVGISPQMQHVYRLVHNVASLNANVLVTGQSGTGKELIARAIHNLGCRADKPFVAISCGAIPDTLIESELFGHEKGAFTGAVGAREGYFEQAADGTLFLDEIGDLSLFTQVKLLRVLQQREFSRLGSNRLLPLRARFVFATHQDLTALVAEGKFRQDLFYRINVMRIESPALQDRPEDIPLLANHFLRCYAESFQKPLRSIDAGVLDALLSYNWPGNVRELENVMQSAIIMAPGSTLRLDDLLAACPELQPAGGRCNLDAAVVNIGDYQPAGSFEQMIQEYKLRLAVTAVRKNNGNKTLAARSLGISRAYLHRLIRMAEPEGVLYTAALRPAASL